MQLNSPLNDFEKSILTQARNMIPIDPPLPWQRTHIISAAGVIAAGWDEAENILLISSDGYSLNDPITGKRIRRETNRESTYAAITPDHLSFEQPTFEKPIRIFGINGGDGIHLTQDGWELEIIYPWWPRSIAIIRTPFVLDSEMHGYLDRAHAIRLERLETTNLKCSFSPTGNHFMIIGSSGAEVFSR